MTEKKKSLYRPEIDGLRAISVVAVLLFHCNSLLPGGFVGVDVFFVISGYLITRLLLRDIDRETFSIGDFWERRVRRILPALAFVLLPVFIAGYFILLPADFSELGQSTLAQAIICANVFFWRAGGYFAGPSELKPLLHTWSLAVEEQFYVFYPLLLVWICRYWRKRVIWILSIGFVVSFIANIVLIDRSASATFYLLPTRAWELLAGCIIAAGSFKGLRKREWLAESFSWSGLLLIFYACFFFSAKTQFPGYAAIVPILGSSLFIVGNTDRLTSAGKLLAFRPMVAVGLISYSLYLWHWPILAYLRYMINDVNVAMLLLGCFFSAALATASYFLVEQPFRKKNLLATRTSLFGVAGCYIALLVIAGGIAWQTGGFPNRFDASVAELTRDATHNGSEYQRTTPQLKNRGFAVIGDSSKEKFDFLLAGDSHAMAVVHVFDDVAKQFGLKGAVATNNTTIPLLDVWSSRKETSGNNTKTWNQVVYDLREKEDIKHVILVAAWNCYLKGWTDEQIAQNPDLSNARGYAISDEHALPSEEGATASVSAGLMKTAQRLNEEETHLWVFKQFPEATQTEIARRFLRWKLYPSLSQAPERNGRELDSYQTRTDRESDLMKRIAQQPHVDVIDLSRHTLYSKKNSYSADHYSNDRAFYKDIGHVSFSGAEAFYTEPVKKLLRAICDGR